MIPISILRELAIGPGTFTVRVELATDQVAHAMVAHAGQMKMTETLLQGVDFAALRRALEAVAKTNPRPYIE